MARTVLAPFDGSRQAVGALPYAAALAGPSGRVVLLRVIDNARAEAAARSLEREAARMLCRLPSLQVHTRVAAGAVRKAVADTASAEGASAIVLSTRGAGGADHMCGSTVATVLQAADVPVLLVSVAGASHWSAGAALRVLVPLDGSTAALAAIDGARELFAGQATRLILVRAVVPIAEVSGRTCCRYMQMSTRQELARASDYLHEQQVRLAPTGIETELRVLVGLPAPAVAAAAREAQAHLVIATTQGASGAIGRITGGTAAGLLQHVETPVILLRPAPRPHTSDDLLNVPFEPIRLASAGARARPVRASERWREPVPA